MVNYPINREQRVNNPINERLEKIIAELSAILKPIQLLKQKDFNNHKYPFAFIVGAPRSGTTLLLQWFASQGSFSYPTNVLNRFAYAPYIGALIQQMLFNRAYDYSMEFQADEAQIQFSSDLGKTKGYLAPNEFQYYFRNYMNQFEPRYLDQSDLKNIDFNGIYQGLCSIESVFNKPFVCKIVMLQFHLAVLHKCVPNSIFLFIKRSPIYNMQSLYNARIKYYGNMETWWSVKPKEYEKLKEMDAYHQIAGQVYYTNKMIESEIELIPNENKILIEYEKFCEDPESLLFKIKSLYSKFNVDIEKYNSIKEKFVNENSLKIKHSEIKKLEKAYENISNYMF